MDHIYDIYKQLYWISLSWAISMIYIYKQLYWISLSLECTHVDRHQL